jgi:apolipoprotein N-acyltransferase
MRTAPALVFPIIALYAGSGLLIGLSVNTFGFTPLAALAWVGCVPMLLAMKQDSPLWAHVAGVFLFSSIKLLLSLFSFITVFAVPGITLVLAGSVISSVPLWLSLFIKFRWGWKNALYILPPLWTAYTVFVSEGLFNLPILSFSLSQAALPWIVQYIDVTGHTGILFFLLCINVILSLSYTSIKFKKELKTRSEREAVNIEITKQYLVVVVFFSLSLMYGIYKKTVIQNSYSGEIQVGMVQPGFAPSESEDNSSVDLFLHQVALTDSLVEYYNPDIILWGEGGIAFPILEDSSALHFLFHKVLEWETPLLTGTFERSYFREDEPIPALQAYLGRNYLIYNSAIMVTPQLAWMHLQEGLPISDIKLYNKANLMPFTEYVPFSNQFPTLSRASVYPSEFGHFSRGNSAEYLHFATQRERVIRVSPIICWDVLPTKGAISAANTGAHFIAALTNESSLGRRFSITALQMESFTRLRSIESRRSIAKVSLTGYTFFTNPLGEVFGKAPWWSAQLSVSPIPTTQYQSFYAKYPYAFPLFNLLLLIYLISRVVTQKDYP